MPWQEHHIAWLKLYHQALWKVSKTINYQGINGGLSYVKHDKVGDLIKKTHYTSEFSEFSNEYGTFFLLSLCLFFSFLHSFLHTNWHTHFPSAAIHVPPLRSQTGCVCVWTFAFIVRIIYLNPSSFFFQSHSISFFFFFKQKLRN